MHRERLARNQILRDQRNVEEQSRYGKLISDLMEEQKAWITLDNIDAKITNSLFEKQSTTGIVKKDSNLWKLQLVTLDFDRVMGPETKAEFGMSSLQERLNYRGQIKSAKRLMVEDFLNPLIGNGEDRAKFKDLVESFSDKFNDADAFDEYEEYLNEVIW